MADHGFVERLDALQAFWGTYEQRSSLDTCSIEQELKTAQPIYPDLPAWFRNILRTVWMSNIDRPPWELVACGKDSELIDEIESFVNWSNLIFPRGKEGHQAVLDWLIFRWERSSFPEAFLIGAGSPAVASKSHILHEFSWDPSMETRGRAHKRIKRELEKKLDLQLAFITNRTFGRERHKVVTAKDVIHLTCVKRSQFDAESYSDIARSENKNDPDEVGRHVRKLAGEMGLLLHRKRGRPKSRK